MYYACTYLCGENFATSDDWRRHENAEHYTQDAWHCIEKLSNGANCCRAFRSKNSYFIHLQNQHQIEATDDFLNQQHINASFSGNFWCGFCQQIVKLQARGLDGWTERFDHIESHYMGSAQDGYVWHISEWTPLNFG